MVDQGGVEIGTANDVRNGELYVEVDPDADPETFSELNWDGAVNQQSHRFPHQYVSNVSDTTIRLSV